jgi:hypothetical protein
MQKETHKAFLATRGLSRQRVIPTTDVNQSERFGILPTREKECLGYSVIAEPEATSFDLNPRIDRLCFGRKFLMPTLTTEDKHWMRQGSGQEGFENKKFNNRLMLDNRCWATRPNGFAASAARASPIAATATWLETR